MKANEFVKKFGLSHSKLFGNGWITFDDGCIENSVSRTDVKRLVESHELILRCGGLHMAKADVMDLDGWEKTSPHWVKIKQAIADVESCL